ncbi:unnamed protein product, partial [Phaeothamnion confervicola]
NWLEAGAACKKMEGPCGRAYYTQLPVQQGVAAGNAHKEDMRVTTFAAHALPDMKPTPQGAINDSAMPFGGAGDAEVAMHSFPPGAAPSSEDDYARLRAAMPNGAAATDAAAGAASPVNPATSGSGVDIGNARPSKNGSAINGAGGSSSGFGVSGGGAYGYGCGYTYGQKPAAAGGSMAAGTIEQPMQQASSSGYSADGGGNGLPLLSDVELCGIIHSACYDLVVADAQVQKCGLRPVMRIIPVVAWSRGDRGRFLAALRFHAPHVDSATAFAYFFPNRSESELLEFYYRWRYRQEDFDEWERARGCLDPASIIPDYYGEVCKICGGDGELVCCDTCPLPYHIGCLGLAAPPSEEPWCCPSCVARFQLPEDRAAAAAAVTEVVDRLEALRAKVAAEQEERATARVKRTVAEAEAAADAAAAAVEAKLHARRGRPSGRGKSGGYGGDTGGGRARTVRWAAAETQELIDAVRRHTGEARSGRVEWVDILTDPALSQLMKKRGNRAVVEKWRNLRRQRRLPEDVFDAVCGLEDTGGGRSGGGTGGGSSGGACDRGGVDGDEWLGGGSAGGGGQRGYKGRWDDLAGAGDYAGWHAWKTADDDALVAAIRKFGDKNWRLLMEGAPSQRVADLFARWGPKAVKARWRHLRRESGRVRWEVNSDDGEGEGEGGGFAARAAAVSAGPSSDEADGEFDPSEAGQDDSDYEADSGGGATTRTPSLEKRKAMHPPFQEQQPSWAAAPMAAPAAQGAAGAGITAEAWAAGAAAPSASWMGAAAPAGMPALSAAWAGAAMPARIPASPAAWMGAAAPAALPALSAMPATDMRAEWGADGGGFGGAEALQSVSATGAAERAAASATWLANQESALVRAVRQFGVGSWAEMLVDPSFEGAFAGRTALDLQDRWRIMKHRLSRRLRQEGPMLQRRAAPAMMAPKQELKAE